MEDHELCPRPEGLDLTRKYGKLSPIGWRRERRGANTVYIVFCRCACGNLRDVKLNLLLKEKIISCGCTRKKRASHVASDAQRAALAKARAIRFEKSLLSKASDERAQRRREARDLKRFSEPPSGDDNGQG